MEEPFISDPRVIATVKAVVRRKLAMFDDYPDLDERSLFADVWGELVKSKYDPSKRAAHSHAYQVASCRLIDISRRREKEAEKRQEAIDAEGVRSSSVDAEMTPEEIAANLYEAARDIFAQASVPLRRPGSGRPGLNRAQQAALHGLQQLMGWSCRQAESSIAARPGVLLAIGVAKPPDHTFFSRANDRVAKFKDLSSLAIHLP